MHGIWQDSAAFIPPHDTRVAVAELASAGIDNFNLDLMYGLPDQTPAEAIADLEGALALEPSHLSHYQLTLEPGHRLLSCPARSTCGR